MSSPFPQDRRTTGGAAGLGGRYVACLEDTAEGGGDFLLVGDLIELVGATNSQQKYYFSTQGSAASLSGFSTSILSLSAGLGFMLKNLSKLILWGWRVL